MLFFSTRTESNSRVTRIFPNGVATEDARAKVGEAPPPPDHEAPNGAETFVIDMELQAPVAAGRARALLPPTNPDGLEHWLKGQEASGQWVHVEDADEDVAFSRLAVIVDFIDSDKALDAPRCGREMKWAAAWAAKLGAPPPSVSMTPEQAAARAKSALAAREAYSDDDVAIGVVLAAPKGARFSGREVWDAVYSAGFTWGDGDCFHWVPSAETDVSQGITIETSTEPSYFLPEALLKTDGSGDVVDLRMTFIAARCWKPALVFDVMARSAAYLARRLGGTVTTHAGGEFHPNVERSKVVAIEKGLLAHGVTPGVGLAMRLF